MENLFNLTMKRIFTDTLKGWANESVGQVRNDVEQEDEDKSDL